jgi:hypothetical protein
MTMMINESRETHRACAARDETTVNEEKEASGCAHAHNTHPHFKQKERKVAQEARLVQARLKQWCMRQLPFQSLRCRLIWLSVDTDGRRPGSAAVSAALVAPLWRRRKAYCGQARSWPVAGRLASDVHSTAPWDTSSGGFSASARSVTARLRRSCVVRCSKKTITS